MQTVRDPNAYAGDPVSSAGGTRSRANLETGREYPGTITRVSSRTRTYDVRLDNVNATVRGCQYAAPLMASMFGYNMDVVLSKGTRVHVLVGNPNWITGCQGTASPDFANGLTRMLLGLPLDALNNSKAYPRGKVVAGGPAPAQDLLEGEFTLTNAFGVGIDFLTNLVRMKAGHAQVELHLLDDLVRVITQNYRTHNAFGDMEVYHDGRLNVVWNGTSYPHEAAGLLDSQSAVFPQDKDRGVDLTQIDRLNDTGRWRWTQYLGFVGDFVHDYVSDPVKALGKIAHEANRSGTYHRHVGNDGKVIVQSVHSIIHEKVVRIPIPVPIKRAEDGTGYKDTDFDTLEEQYLKFWDGGPNNQDLHHAAYQLREYARWLSQYSAMARFHQLSAGDKAKFRVPSEEETPEPDPFSDEADRKRANQGKTGYKLVYATTRICADGSVLELNGAGAAVLLGMKEVVVSSHLDLRLEGARNIYMTAGQDIVMNARRNIQINAAVGGITMHARTWFKTLCELGSIHLKSDAEDPKKGKASNPAEDGPEPLQLEHAILLDAPQARLGVLAGRQIMVSAEGAPDSDDDADKSASVIIQSRRQDVHLLGQRNTVIQAISGYIGILTERKVLLRAQEFLGRVQGLFDINQKFTLRGRSLHVADLRTNTMIANLSIQGPERPGPSPGGGTHLNHIDKKSGDKKPEHATDVEDLDKLNDLPKTPTKFFEERGPEWTFESPDHTAAEEVFESLTQQQLRADEVEGYEIWRPGQDRLLGNAERTDRNSVALPGKDAQHLVHNGGESLNTPSSIAPNAQNKQTRLKKSRVEFRYKS